MTSAVSGVVEMATLTWATGLCRTMLLLGLAAADCGGRPQFRYGTIETCPGCHDTAPVTREPGLRTRPAPARSDARPTTRVKLTGLWCYLDTLRRPLFVRHYFGADLSFATILQNIAADIFTARHYASAVCAYSVRPSIRHTSA